MLRIETDSNICSQIFLLYPNKIVRMRNLVDYC